MCWCRYNIRCPTGHPKEPTLSIEEHSYLSGVRGQAIRRFLCLLPGLFLVNEFTVPGAAMKQGRRQEPCTTTRSPTHNSTRDAMDLRFPVAVLLRSTIRKRETAKPLPRSISLYYHPASE